MGVVNEVHVRDNIEQNSGCTVCLILLVVRLCSKIRGVLIHTVGTLAKPLSQHWILHWAHSLVSRVFQLFHLLLTCVLRLLPQ